MARLLVALKGNIFLNLIIDAGIYFFIRSENIDNVLMIYECLDNKGREIHGCYVWIVGNIPEGRNFVVHIKIIRAYEGFQAFCYLFFKTGLADGFNEVGLDELHSDAVAERRYAFLDFGYGMMPFPFP